VFTGLKALLRYFTRTLASTRIWDDKFGFEGSSANNNSRREGILEGRSLETIITSEDTHWIERGRPLKLNSHNHDLICVPITRGQKGILLEIASFPVFYTIWVYITGE